jgi:hypothetical protein
MKASMARSNERILNDMGVFAASLRALERYAALTRAARPRPLSAMTDSNFP